MDSNFLKVKNYLLDLEYSIVSEDEANNQLIIENEDAGINNMFITVGDPILVMEQYLFDMPADNGEIFKQLLIKNRDIIHGAFVLDESGKKVIFRDTLQIENLDGNEIEGSLQSLELLLSEFYDSIIKFSKGEV